MNKAVKKAWVTRLRSGQYTQGSGYLNNEGKFCCLGVLCELAVDSGVDVLVESGDDEDICYNEQNTILPPEVIEWAGLEDFNPDILESDGQKSTLATVNDSGTSFKEIADLIEKQY